MNKIHYGFIQVGGVILVASVFAAGLLVKNVSFGSVNAAAGCKTYKDAKSCNSACSPEKGKDNKSFECKWIGGGCREGAKVCGEDNKTPKPDKTSEPTDKPTKSPTSTPTPKPTKKPTVTPSMTPTPTITPSPSITATPTVTPVADAKLKLCKYEDKNGNGQRDGDEKTISWKFLYKYQDKEYTAETPWWDIVGDRCVTVKVPANQWVRVWEESRSGWSLTNIIADGTSIGGSDYSYIPSSDTQKDVLFLNRSTPGTTPTPTVRPTSTPTTPPVLGATAPPSLPKTGVNGMQIVFGLLTLMGGGFVLFKRFKLA